MSYCLKKNSSDHCADNTGMAGKVNVVYHNGNKTFLLNKELPPEKLKYLILNWTVTIIKWKQQWKDLSTNMKADIHIS